MGRNKRTSVVDNGTNSDTHSDSVPVAKKPKKQNQQTTMKKTAKQDEKLWKKVNNNNTRKNKGGKKKVGEVTSTTTSDCEVRKSKIPQIYTDSSTTSESDSEKNSFKNDKKSMSESISDSEESESESNSSGSESSQLSKPASDKKLKTNNLKDAGGRKKNLVVNLNPVKSYNPPPKSSGSDSYHSDTEEEDKKRRKKQKEMLKMQLNKKTTKMSTSKKQETFHNIWDMKEKAEDGLKVYNEEDDDAPAVGEGAGTGCIGLDWPEADVFELIRRMENQIPPKDNQKYDLREAKLNWDKIAFDFYTSEECRDIWFRISKSLRKYRLLGELLVDAREWAKTSTTNFQKRSRNVARVSTEVYKNSPSKDREKYAEKGATEKQVYNEKNSELDQAPQAQLRTMTREIVKGPKKPNPPFKMFLQDQFKKYSSETSVDKKSIEETAKELWKNLSDKRKLEWINRSLEDVNRYKRELKAFKMKHPDYDPPNANKNILNKEERSLIERLSGKPVKPPNSAYSLFSRHMLQSDDDVKSKAPKLRMAEISKKWKEITALEKSEYEEKVKELQHDYKAKFQLYLNGLNEEERRKLSELDTNQKRKKKEKLTKKTAKPKNAKSSKKNKENISSQLYKGEPEPPPVRVYDLFLEKFIEDRPAGMSEEARLKQAPKYWEKLPPAEKEYYQEALMKLKENYISEYEIFLKGLSAEELKEFSMKKAKDKKEEEQLQRMNGTLTDSNCDSDEEKYESSSEDSHSEDSDDSRTKKAESDSDKSKSCSSSDDSDG